MNVFRTATLAASILICALPVYSADYIAECNKQIEAGDYYAAAESGRKAVDSANRNVDAHFCLAEAWRLNGDLQRAQQQMKTAETFAKDDEYLDLRLALNEITPDQYMKIQKEQLLKISGRLGAIATKQGDYASAIEEYKRSIVLAKELSDKDQEATALSSLAGVRGAMREYEQSLENYREALTLTTREPEISSLYNNMAVVYGQMGNYKVAEEYFAKALTIDEKLGDYRAMAIHLLNQGMTTQARKDYAGAAAIYGKSRAISRKAGELYWEGAANRHFGDLYRLLGNMRLARLSYIASRDAFNAAHAVNETSSMVALIDDLDEPQPVAGIEIGSSDVKTLLIAQRTDKRGKTDFREILKMTSGTVSPVPKEGEALSPEEIDSFAAGVAASTKTLLQERKLDRSVISILVTGIPAIATNRDVLEKRIIQETGIAPIYMNDGEKKRYDFSGSVAQGRESEGLLLKVSVDETSIHALDSDKGVLSVELKQGAFTAASLQEKNPKAVAEKLIRGGQAKAFRKALKSSPAFAGRKTIYLEGEVARVVALFTHPDRDGNLVSLTTADLNKFITAVRKKATPYFNPNLKRIKDSGVQQWAESEMTLVKQKYMPDDLMAGVQYLKMLMEELKVKKAYVTRGGSWVAGKLYESARMAETLEAARQ
ncbi:MAG: tetratricopeptide repeat protein [Geobacteraceae bacterium]|nr:tetratricopeptide repeat protein [Geobacteraceae bacterium]